MKKMWAIAAFAMACPFLPVAAAQTIEASDASSCPGEAVSVYFASGETALSSEGRALVTRLGDQAIACRPAGIDIVTLINADIDGERAVELALARLQGVSKDLVARGISPDAIRIAARPGSDVFPPGMSEVEVIFRRSSVGAGEASTRAPAPLHPQPPGAI